MSKTKIQQHTLDNGMMLIGETNPLNKSCSIGFFVGTGARDEFDKESGISHFLEHMMFKGTQKRSAMDITLDLGNLGAQANAYTSEENTVYYGSILPEYFGGMQELLSDMLRPALDPEEFSMEKKVILEEIALYQDRPQFFLFETAFIDYFAGHPAGNSVLGTTGSVSEITHEQMRAYFNRRYSPSNMCKVASGDFDWDQFVSNAEKYCGAWEDIETSRDRSRYVGKVISKEYRKKNISQAHVLFITEGSNAQEDCRYAHSLLSVILGDSSGSKLYWDLVDKGIAESAGADNDEKDGTGCFMAFASMEPENIDKVADIMLRVLSSPLDFSEEDLERAKTKLLSRIVLDGEMPIGRLMSLGLEWRYRARIHKLKEEIEQYKSVTVDDIRKLFEKYPMKDWGEFRLLPE